MTDASSVLVEAYRYKVWADGRTIDAIRCVNSENAPSSVQFLTQQLNHMTIVEEMFRARLSGEESPHAKTNTELLPDLSVLIERNALSNKWYASYCGGLSPQQLVEGIRFRFSDGAAAEMSRQEILFHVINHGTYHRGAISHALDLAGVPHPVDGFAAFANSTQSR